MGTVVQLEVSVMAILDSGERHTFDSGAVRDIQTNKGRPTLMPLHVVATLLDTRLGGDPVMANIAMFTDTGNTNYLYHALGAFAKMAYDYKIETMLLEVAIHYSDGCEKYGEDNWKRGIPVNCYLDSAIRHYLKYHRGDTDEPHNRAFVWNIMCCIWEVENHAENENH